MTIIRPVPAEHAPSTVRPETPATRDERQGAALDLVGIVGTSAAGPQSALLALMRPGAGPTGQRATDLTLPSLPVRDANGREIASEVHRPDGITARTDNNGVYTEYDQRNRLTFLRMPGQSITKTGTTTDGIRLTYDGDSMQPSSATDSQGHTIRAGGQNQIVVNHQAGFVSMSGEVTDPGAPERTFAYSSTWNATERTRVQSYPQTGMREFTHYSTNNDGGIGNPIHSAMTYTYDDNAGGVQTSSRLTRSDGYGWTTFGDPRNVPPLPANPNPPLGQPFQLAETRYPAGTVMTFADGQGNHRIDVERFGYSTDRNNQPILIVTGRDGVSYMASGVVPPQQEIRHGAEHRAPIPVANWQQLIEKKAVMQAQPGQIAVPGAPAQPGMAPQAVQPRPAVPGP